MCWQVNDEEELEKLQVLHDHVYDQARKWFQNLENRFRNQILQHFGPMPEREADIQVFPAYLISATERSPAPLPFFALQQAGRKEVGQSAFRVSITEVNLAAFANTMFSEEEWHALNNNGGRLLLCKLHERSQSLYVLSFAI